MVGGQPLLAGAEEGAAAVPDRQGRRPSQRPGHGPLSGGLEGGRDDGRRPRGHRRLLVTPLGGQEMEETILRLARQGKTDEEIAGQLTQAGLPFPRDTNRPAQHGSDRPPAPRSVPRPPSIAPAADPRLPDGPTADGEAEDRTKLDLRSHPQRHDPDRARCRAKDLPVSRHSRDPRPVPATPGRKAQQLAFLGGYQDARSKNFRISTSTIQPPPISIVCCHRLSSAWCAERPGRKPYEQSRKSCS